jgi:hypothetical protein
VFDKVLLKFLSDVLYAKGLLNSDEIDDIYDATSVQDLDVIFERMLGGEYNNNRRGESYYRVDVIGGE